MESLHFVDACTDEHFRAMSLIHALGWRDTYADAVPADAPKKARERPKKAEKKSPQRLRARRWSLSRRVWAAARVPVLLRWWPKSRVR